VPACPAESRSSPAERLAPSVSISQPANRRRLQVKRQVSCICSDATHLVLTGLLSLSLQGRFVSQAFHVSIPHRLGRDEAVRRLKSGLDRAGRDFASVIAIQQQTWIDNTLTFRVGALGQTAMGSLEVLDSSVRLELTLPWLLAKLADRFLPKIEQTGRLLLEHK
jgi:hypothetical protein